MPIAPASIPFPRLRLPRLEAASFAATSCNTAEDKAAFGNKLLGFIAEGFPESRFTASLYSQLTMTFGHIAHYSKHGYWDYFFSHTDGRIEFLDQTMRHVCLGSPAHTFCDVERAVKRRLRDVPLLDAYRSARSAEIAAAEREMLRRLKNKYEPAVATAVPDPPRSGTPRQLDLLAS